MSIYHESDIMLDAGGRMVSKREIISALWDA